MSSTYLVRYVVLTADRQGVEVYPEGTDPRKLEEAIPLDTYCAQEGVEFIGWHPTYTLLGVFRRNTGQEAVRIAVAKESPIHAARSATLDEPNQRLFAQVLDPWGAYRDAQMTQRIEAATDDVLSWRRAHCDALLIAFLTSEHVPVMEVELVETLGTTENTWHFRQRTPATAESSVSRG